MNDYAHELTEKELANLEKRIAKLYKEAHDELEETVKSYFESFEKRDSEMKKLIGTIQNGKEWTEADYKQWRLNQIGRGERFEALRDLMAERYTQANEIAIAYVNDETPGIYSLNRNYSAYTIDKATGGALTIPKGKMDASWTLFDESTVRRLMVENPGLMPNYPAAKALKRGIDLAYGKKQITSSVTSAILQGKSIKGIADDLQSRIPDMNRASAIRTARTSITGAQNGGRQDTYQSAVKMGIKMRKQWLATLDSRTRHSHAMLDGEIIEVGGKYSNGCRYPGDPHGKPHEVYNCRCTEIAVLDDVDTSDAQRRAGNPETGENVLIRDMSYQEWAGWKQKETIPDYKRKPQGSRRQFMVKEQAVKETFRFQPYSRKEDAAEYMGRISKSQSGVSVGDGVTLEQENAINYALTDVYNRYGVKLDIRTVRTVTTQEGRKIQAAYQPQNGTLAIRGSESNWKKIAEKNYGTRFGASPDKYETLYHELGHALWKEIPSDGKTMIEASYNKFRKEAYNRWLDDGGSRLKKTQADYFADYLSKYGSMDDKEFFSECFAQIMTGYEGEAAFEVSLILEEVLKRVR